MYVCTWRTVFFIDRLQYHKFLILFFIAWQCTHSISRYNCKIFFRFYYHRFPWYATFENKIPAETFPKFPSIIHVVDRSDRNSPITVRLTWLKEGVKVTLVAVIGGFWSDLSITRKTDGNFRNVFGGCFVFQSRVSRKTVVKRLLNGVFFLRTSQENALFRNWSISIQSNNSV